ncbi:MAG: cytochrome C assembly family protein, partial [bacterium]
MIRLEQWLVVVAYALAFVQYLNVFRTAKALGVLRPGQLAGIAIGLHLGYLCHLTVLMGHLPVTSVFEALTTCAWLFGVVYLILEWRLREPSLGLFILPFILILQILSNLFLDVDRQLPQVLLAEVVFEIHVIILLLAYSAFAISFIASLFYLQLSREIQKKSPGLFYRRLPSLAFFDSLSNRGVNIGLVFLTIGVALGVYEGFKLAEQFLQWDLKYLAVALTWMIYALHLLGRLALGWLPDGRWDSRQAAALRQAQ